MKLLFFIFLLLSIFSCNDNNKKNCSDGCYLMGNIVCKDSILKGCIKNSNGCLEFKVLQKCQMGCNIDKKSCISSLNCGDNQYEDNGECLCKEGFYLKNNKCLKNKKCSDNPCQNNGKCEDFENSYICKCPEGYDGKNCDIIIGGNCSDNPCQNNGKCIQNENSYRCDCTDTGYTGNNCMDDIDECEDSSMNNCDNLNGYCINNNGSFECSCNENFVLLDEKCVFDCNQYENTHLSNDICICNDKYYDLDNDKNCECHKTEVVEFSCNDGVDNDCDGNIDNCTQNCIADVLTQNFNNNAKNRAYEIKLNNFEFGNLNTFSKKNDCSYADDWYKILLKAGEKIKVKINSNNDSNIDLYFLNINNILTKSVSENSKESIEYSPPYRTNKKNHYIEIKEREKKIANYNIKVLKSCADGYKKKNLNCKCAVDEITEESKNYNFNRAYNFTNNNISLKSLNNLKRNCSLGEDHYKLKVPRNKKVRITATPIRDGVANLGDVVLSIDYNNITDSENPEDSESTILEDGEYHIIISDYKGGHNNDNINDLLIYDLDIETIN